MYRFVKHRGDFVLALILLILCSPLILLLLAVIPICSPGNPIYKQIRVGKDRKKFVAYKLRTRVINAHELEADTGVTSAESHHHGIGIYPFGGFLRKFSIDELLQLINVLKGDMSLIGPRPPQPEEIVNFWEPYAKRFGVLPGITGLAQISGRDSLPKLEQLIIDCIYVENQSFWLDLIILFLTPGVVRRGTGS